MPANTNPIFTLTPKIGWGEIATANTDTDGTGTIDTDIIVVFTAGASGSRVEKIVFAHLGTNIQTVARIFVNNGDGNNIATNNCLVAEVTIEANTLTQTDAQNITEYQFIDGLQLPAGYRILVAIGTTIASGLKVSGHGGDY